LSKLKPEEGRLYVVSTPIGNFNDITIRALNVLREADLIICENFKEATALLKYFSLDKELDSITVKDEGERYPEFILKLEEGKTIALISDCGTPAFADPGSQLINSAISRDIDVQVLPGATSIMTALVRSTFDIDTFFFAGFLPRTTTERVAELRKLSKMDSTFCLLETPYRLMPLLEDAAQVIPDRRAYLACNLTMKNETHHYGTITELLEKFKEKKVKMEFVFIVEGNVSGLPVKQREFVDKRAEKIESYDRDNYKKKSEWVSKPFKREYGDSRKKRRSREEDTPDRRSGTSGWRKDDDRSPRRSSSSDWKKDGDSPPRRSGSSDWKKDGDRPPRKSGSSNWKKEGDSNRNFDGMKKRNDRNEDKD